MDNMLLKLKKFYEWSWNTWTLWIKKEKHLTSITADV